MKFWENFSSFDIANEAWDKNQAYLESNTPLKKVQLEPKIKVTFSKFIRIKSLFYLIVQDKKFKLLKYFIKNPLFYLFNLLRSYLTKEPYVKEKELFLFNLNSLNELKNIALNKNALFIFGFSYCQKPIECPKKRFSSECFHNYQNDICSQCFIGKCANAINTNDIFLVIPDVYFIGDKLIDLIHQNPKKEIVFIITSCELSIKMFSDFANMLKIKGLGLQLTKRVCVNFESFLYAEKGKKSGLTDLDTKNKNLFFEILKLRYDSENTLI